MSEASPFDWDIHRRLLAGDPTASAELAAAYLEPIAAAVRGAAGRTPNAGQLEYDAVIDAWISYVNRPEQYDPDMMALRNYLTMSARGDLANAIVRTGRRAAKVVPLDVVVLGDGGGNSLQTGDDFVNIEDTERVVELRRHIEQALPDPLDRRLAEFLLDGVRETEPYAAILGITHLDIKEQRDTVNRHKDRLKRRLKRLGERLREQGG